MQDPETGCKARIRAVRQQECAQAAVVGVGIASTALYDDTGRLGAGQQSLLVTAR